MVNYICFSNICKKFPVFILVFAIMEDLWEDRGDDTDRKTPIIKTATDLQRLKLEKLMKHPDRPVLIPERYVEKGVPAVPEFVRNVMGSSAGAGSGEFHVYRHLRRKEYARQKYMKERGERERLDDEYRSRLEENKKTAADKTAKKRAKRLKKKTKKKRKVSQCKVAIESETDSSADNSKSEPEDNYASEKDTDENLIICNSEEYTPKSEFIPDQNGSISKNENFEEISKEEKVLANNSDDTSETNSSHGNTKSKHEMENINEDS